MHTLVRPRRRGQEGLSGGGGEEWEEGEGRRGRRSWRDGGMVGLEGDKRGFAIANNDLFTHGRS